MPPRHRRPTPRRASPRRAIAAAAVERLEARAVPATFLVATLADAGPRSLRDAVERANASPGPDTIRFAPSLSGSIRLTTGALEVTDELAIDGPGAARLAISGERTSRIFSLAGAAAALSLDDVTLTAGRATTVDPVGPGLVRGGAIRNDGGRLDLLRVAFVGNRAESDPAAPGAAGVVGGGAVVNSAGASLRATDCVFRDNVVSGGTRYAFGGAIANVTDSTATLVRCTFRGNQALGSAAVHGGAVGSFGASTLVVRGGSFIVNEATGTGTAPASGGAIATRPGTVSTSGSSTTIDGARFTANRATGGSEAADATGGALASADSSLAARGCVFVGNEATAGAGGVAVGGAIGAGSAFGGVVPATLVARSSFRANRAVAGAGGVAFGGACAATEGTLEIAGSLFSRNAASAPSAGATGGIACGGAIAIGPPAAGRADQSASLLFRSSTVSGNSVTGSRAEGGGLFAGTLVPAVAPRVRISSVRFAGNVPEDIVTGTDAGG